MVKYFVIFFAFLTIAFGQTERWIYWYNGPGSYYDFANTIVYGTDGNIYAAGRCYGGDTTEYDLVVVSVTPDNIQRWTYEYQINGIGWDEAYSIVYGADGNIYLAGVTSDTTTYCDFTVISLTNTGSERWVYRYDGLTHFNDYAYSLVYGADGNLYVAGKSSEQDYQQDLTIISLNTAGSERWVYYYNGTADDDDWANSICYGEDGNIYAAGRSSDSTTRQDFTLISLTNTGSERWVYTYNGPYNDYDEANAIVYGADNNIYAAGRGYGDTSSYDFTLVSVTNSGSERWVYNYNGPGNDDDIAHALVYGADGNVYASGYSSGEQSGPDFTVLSVTANGAERWVYRYHQYGRTWDDANALVYGPDGNIYAAGYGYAQSGTTEDIVVSSLSNSGTENWLYRFSGPYNGYDEAFCITYGADGYIYTAGTSNHSLETQLDLIIISLIPTGGIEEENPINRNPQTAFHISLGTFQNQNLNYTLSQPEPATVSLALYNISGQKVLDWQVNSSEKTSHYVKNLPSVSPGVYFLKAEVSGKGYKENRKFIIMK
jgi:uncharacterized delta-60 repeat protein